VSAGDPSAADRRRAAAHVLLDTASSADLDATVIVPDTRTDHHLRRVLRLAGGAVVSVTDGAGRWRLTEVAPSGLAATSDVVADPRDRTLTIAAAIPKGDRLDWMVQKCTELGADRIVLLDAERSVVRWKADRAARQLARVQRIADEATRQSRRVWRTEVSGPVPALDVLPTACAAEPGGRPVRALGDVDVVAIGPEGGWSDDELAAARATVDLGPHVLRVETAALAATTLCARRDH
jgi:16S rRNA (uracil1498-N3)-methyltransferase